LTGSPYIAQAVLKLAILLPQSPECWDDRCTLLCLAPVCFYLCVLTSLSPLSPGYVRVSLRVQGGSGNCPKLGMTLFSPQQYPDGVFYDLDSCKHSGYPDSQGTPGE
jgi:hypothetical protein